MLRLYPAAGLREELTGLRQKQSGPSWTFDHAAGRHDDMAVAVALMATELLSRPAGIFENIDSRPTPAERMTTSRGGLTLTGERYFDQDPDTGELIPPPGHDAEEAL